MYYILLDEVQFVKDFEDVLNSFLHIQNADTYVTGSNAKFLSKDIITEFRGRGDEVHLFPLSFSEFAKYSSGDKYSLWKEYLNFGGLPKLMEIENEEDKSNYLKNIFTETYLKDILAYSLPLYSRAKVAHFFACSAACICGFFVMNRQKASN